MGLFAKTTAPEKELAKTLAKRGTPGQALILGMSPTGRIRENGVAREFEFTLTLEASGHHHEVVVKQFMNELSLTGLGLGEPVSVLYDREAPATLMVVQSPKVIFVRNPNAAVDGQTAIAIPITEAGERENY